VPGLEDRARVGVVAAESLEQIAARGEFEGVPNALQRHVLHKHMGRHHDDARQGPQAAAGVDQRDRAAVAVAEQEGALQLQGIQQRGQYLQRLHVHVARRVGLAPPRGGAPVAVA